LFFLKNPEQLKQEKTEKEEDSKPEGETETEEQVKCDKDDTVDAEIEPKQDLSDSDDSKKPFNLLEIQGPNLSEDESDGNHSESEGRAPRAATPRRAAQALKAKLAESEPQVEPTSKLEEKTVEEMSLSRSEPEKEGLNNLNVAPEASSSPSSMATNMNITVPGKLQLNEEIIRI
jgi:hypothetical protein